MLIKVLVSSYYARQDMRTPVKIAGLSLMSNVFFNFLFMIHFAHAGLALATSLAAIINTLLLLTFLLKQKIYQPIRRRSGKNTWGRYLLKLLFATASMSVALLSLNPTPHFWLVSSWPVRFTTLFGLIFLGIFLYVFLFFLMGLRGHDFEEPLFEKH